jgi:hypothetical protein
LAAAWTMPLRQASSKRSGQIEPRSFSASCPIPNTDFAGSPSACCGPVALGAEVDAEAFEALAAAGPDALAHLPDPGGEHQHVQPAQGGRVSPPNRYGFCGGAGQPERMELCLDMANTPTSGASGWCGWSWITATSTGRSGRRSLLGCRDVGPPGRAGPGPAGWRDERGAGGAGASPV